MIACSTVIPLSGRSLRGNVDRNLAGRAAATVARVVPYVGTWIEIRRGKIVESESRVVPYVGTWIEI